MDLAELAYMFTRTLPDDERFGMCSQIRRSSSSIPANIAEGYGRESRQEFIRFLRVAQGSLKELETHALLAERVHTGNTFSEDILRRADELGRMLRSFIRSLQAK